MTGNIDLGTADDTASTGGSSGNADLGAGEDLLNAWAPITGDISAAAGNDTINIVELSGSADLGVGDDKLVVWGIMAGEISGGAGAGEFHFHVGGSDTAIYTGINATITDLTAEDILCITGTGGGFTKSLTELLVTVIDTGLGDVLLLQGGTTITLKDIGSGDEPFHHGPAMEGKGALSEGI
jgi:hypothetical protein